MEDVRDAEEFEEVEAADVEVVRAPPPPPPPATLVVPDGGSSKLFCGYEENREEFWESWRVYWSSSITG